MATLSTAARNAALDGIFAAISPGVFLFTDAAALLGSVACPFDAASGGDKSITAPVTITCTAAGVAGGLVLGSGSISIILSPAETTFALGIVSVTVGQQVRVNSCTLSLAA